MAIDRIPGVGPTNADIATAVAAPSAATIASTVAASVPTLAQINTSVSTNASPFGGTWANVAASSGFTGVNSTTISGLTGYKFLRIMFNLSSITLTTGAQQHGIRFNGDATGAYWTMSSYGNSGFDRYLDDSSLRVGQNPGYGGMVVLDILNANSTTASKIINIRNTNNPGSYTGSGLWLNNAAISSVTLINLEGGTFAGSCRVIGAN